MSADPAFGPPTNADNVNVTLVAPAPRTFEEAVDAILSEMRAVMIRKQRDYGSGNIAAFGELGVLVRAHDKLARLRHLLWERRGQAPENEPVEDSWLDLANYGLIGLMCRRRWWGLPMAEDGKSGDV